MSNGLIADLVVRVPDTAALRKALGDPQLELLPADEHPDSLDGRVLTPIIFDGRSVGALLHDPSLSERPGFDEALAVIALALEKDQANKLLREQRDLLSAIGDATPALLCLISGDGLILPDGANEAVRRLTGNSQSLLGGKRFWDMVIAEDQRAEVERLIAAVVSGEVVAEQISRWRRPDGYALVAWTCSRLPDVLTEPIFLISGVDVTLRELRTQELRESRSRLVEAASAERRRLERNLHDGAQQRLVSVSLTLRLAQAKLRGDPNASEEMLREAASELALALEELRELARGLHPAVLTERGLGAAIRALAERAPIPVDIEAQLEHRPPEEVEVALFYVVSESLTNTAKYAQATVAHVEVTSRSGLAVAVIRDDGIGGAKINAGTGLRGLADRVEALDGTFELTSPPGGGTTVRAAIPITG